MTALIAFRGATAYEAQVGRLWIRLPFWRYVRLGRWPTVGWENSE